MLPISVSSSFDYAGGTGWTGYMTVPGASPEPSPDRVPVVREQTGAQQGRAGWSNATNTDRYASGSGPMGFPVSVGGSVFNYSGGKLNQPPRYRYSTYRIMDQQPTLKLARRMLAWRILSSTWTYRGVDSTVPGAWISLIKDMMSPLRYRFLDQGLRYTSSGWRPFELCWTLKNGKHWLKRLKPLAPELTNVIADKGGNFVGLYQPMDQVTLRVDRYEAFKVTHDGDADDHHGTSRHESAYEPWIHWQQTRLDQLRLSDKIAGIIPILKFPPGVSLINGVQTDNSELAQRILDDIAHATGVAFQAYEWDKNQLSRNPELAKITDWSIDWYDAGSLAPAQSGMIETAQYDDNMMLRAWETPERSAISSNAGGAKADSEVHSDSGVSAVEMVDDDLAEQFNRGPVNMALLCNVGEEALDRVLATPAPHVERKRMAAAAFMKLLIVDPIIRKAFLRCADVNELIDLCEIPRSKGFEISEDELNAAGQQPNNGSSNPTGGAVSTGATNKSVVGRTRGSIAASRKTKGKGKPKADKIDFKDIQDRIAELYEFIQAPESAYAQS